MSVMAESATPDTSAQSVSQKKQKTGPKSSGLTGHHGASPVWTHFEKVLLEGTTKYSGIAICNYCKVSIEAPTSRGTNKLWHHLRKKCKDFPGFEEDKSQSLLNFSGEQPSIWRFDQDKCRNALAKMTILDELPFSHVEKEGFKMFCQEMQPKFHVVSRQTLTTDCVKIFQVEKQKLKEHVNGLSSRVSLTTDMWTSIQNLGYMVVTAHFVDKDWCLRKKIISFKVLPHPHKGEAISMALEDCLLEWNIEKVMTITLDNARNNDTCMKDLKERLNERNFLLLNGECFHVRCFAHVINLVVKEGVEEVKLIVKRLRHSVKYVRSGPSRMQLFKKCALEENVTTKRIVCMDVKTRWNSTYLMINSALELEKVFRKLHKHDPFYKIECSMGVLDKDDWEVLKALHLFLEEFYELTKRVSGSTYVTSNAYFDELTQIKDLIHEQMSSPNKSFVEMAIRMDTKLAKYCEFDALNPILVVAIVLDPRYKLNYVEFWYASYLEKLGTLNEEERNEKVNAYVERLKSLMVRLYSHYKVEYTSIMSNKPSNSQSVDVANSQAKKRTSSTKDLFKGLLKRKDSGETNYLDKYLGDDAIEDEGDFDILFWWRDRVSTYHALAMMARDILSIPVTSVASECAFSTAGRVLDPFRSSLTPTVVESLVCTQDWLRTPTPPIEIEEKLEVLEEIENVVLEELRNLTVGSAS